MVEYIAEKLKKADLVLVGLGEEVDALTDLKKNPQYLDLAQKLETSWILSFVNKIEMEGGLNKRKELYQLLSACLRKKNYFVVSVCMDGLIHHSGLSHDRMVAPCGGYDKLQCSERCSTELYDIPEETIRQVKLFLNGERQERELTVPICPNCGKPLVFNNVDALHYVEEGYLDQWSVYKKWLQGTMNKEVCVLEIGVGMKYPTVIRWPFEKIAFYNKKAELFRVHSRLYQISEEIKERGHGICEKPEDFIKELSKML
ncbi:MAG: hypothetical protein K2H52_05190 [Lachnospiraceae bacterium]|nr:hypothetical protein [Lachnospiraceae bacterium]